MILFQEVPIHTYITDSGGVSLFIFITLFLGWVIYLLVKKSKVK